MPRLANAISSKYASAERTADGISSITPEVHLAGGDAIGAQPFARTRGEVEQEAGVAGVGDHRRHHLDRPGDRGPVAGAQLGHEELGPVRGEPQRPDAEERVVLDGHRQVRDRLVATDVEEPDRDRVAAERLDRLAVRGRLLVLGRRRRPLEEQELGAEQAHAARPERAGRRRLGGRADVREQRDLHAVPS